MRSPSTYVRGPTPPAPLVRPPRGAFELLVGVAVLLGPAYALLTRADPRTLPSLCLSIVTALAALGALRRPTRAVRTLLALLLAASIPVHYGGTAAVIEGLGRPLCDASLARVDDWLLGAWLPHGQLAIWVDRSSTLGPSSSLGRILTEVFQVSYVSYYVWGFGLLFLLLARLGSRDGWNVLRAYLVAWVGAFLLNFVLYVLVPAMGPWWAYPDWYAQRVEGLWLAEPLRALVAEHQVTPDCFPSGHTALSWIAALVALRVAPRYGRVAAAAACLITVATLWLRYHYAVDLLAAVPLLVIGLAAGGFLRRGGAEGGAAASPVRTR